MAAGLETLEPCSASVRCLRWPLVVAFVLCPAPVFALLINLSFHSVEGSVLLTGAGSTAAGLNFGRVSAFEPVDTGVTRAVGATSYAISSRFGVRVTHALGLVSPNYTLRARLQSAHVLAWRVDGVPMTTAPATIAVSQPYGSVLPHTVSFVVPFAHPAGAVTAVLEVTAIAN